jgi:acetoin utilization deacetylase AcuC-like enzyme
MKLAHAFQQQWQENPDRARMLESYLDDGGDSLDVLLQRQEAAQEQVLEQLEVLRVHAAQHVQVLARQLERRALEVDVEPGGVCRLQTRCDIVNKAITVESEMGQVPCLSSTCC